MPRISGRHRPLSVLQPRFNEASAECRGFQEQAVTCVILPASLTFTTGVPEVMELTGGKCRVRMKGEDKWTEYQAGQSFDVPANSAFDIEVTETMDYVCHYG